MRTIYLKLQQEAQKKAQKLLALYSHNKPKES